MLKFKNILVHYDSRADAHIGLDYAVELAKSNGGRLKIIEMIPDFPWPTRQFLSGYERVVEEITQAKMRHLDELARPYCQQGIDVTTKVLDGRTSVGMIREVLRDDHDLVIKEAKGKHSRRVGFFGTTAIRLLRKCPCPVLILKPDCLDHHERVVATVSALPDDELHTKLNEQIVRLAKEAATRGAPEVLTAWSVYGESMLKEHMNSEEFDQLQDRTERHVKRKLDEMLAKLDMRVGDANVHVLHSDAGEIIPKFIRERGVNLLVMGPVARSGIAGLLTGNTAEQILNRVECSVLAIKPEGFVSPIRL